MIFGPLNLLLYLFTTALSLVILGGGIYFVWGWYEGALTSIGFLVGGTVMVLFSLVGKYPIIFLLGRKRADGSPYASPTPESHRIARPDGSEIYLEAYGPPAAPTLILTHGLTLDETIWNYVKQDLCRDFRVIAWDVPGFGRSQLPTRGPYTLEVLADDLHSVVEFAGAGPIVLAGHSMGGMITLTYCRTHHAELGTRVTGLALIQTSYTNPVKTARFGGLLTALEWPVLRPLCYLMIGLSPLFWLMNLQNYLSGMAHLGCHLTGFAGNENPQQLDYASRYTIKCSPSAAAKALLAMFGYDAQDVLPRITVPTIVITGDHDIVTLPSAGEVIHRGIAGSTRSELTGSGHLSLLERHDQLTHAVRGLISQSVAPARPRLTASAVQTPQLAPPTHSEGRPAVAG